MKNLIFCEPSYRFNPLNDFLFLKVMGEKGDEKQLLGFLNAVLGRSGKKLIKTVDILENKTFTADIKSGKSCALDVKAVLEDETKVNIEVQVRNDRNIERRSLFYWSRLYIKGLRQGQDYRELPDVAAINIVDFDFPPGGGAHTCFHLREDADRSLILSSALEIHFINMVKWRRSGSRDLRNNPLDRWLVWLDAKSPPELVQEVLRMDSAIMAANERQEFVLQDEEALDIYERRQKAEWDYASGMNGARREGEEKAKLQIARNLLAKGSTPEFVRDITGLSLDEIEKL